MSVEGVCGKRQGFCRCLHGMDAGKPVHLFLVSQPRQGPGQGVHPDTRADLLVVSSYFPSSLVASGRSNQF